MWAANGRRGGAHARSIMRLAVCECWGACCLRVAASGCEHMRRNPRCTDRTSRRQTAICPLRRGGRIGAGRGWRLLKRRDAHDRRWHKCSGASCCAVACAQSCGRLDTRGRLEPWCTSGRHSAPRRLTRVQRCAPSGARPRAPRSLGGRRCSAWVGRSGASGSWPSSRTPSPGGRAQSPKPGASADGGRGGGGAPRSRPSVVVAGSWRDCAKLVCGDGPLQSPLHFTVRKQEWSGDLRRGGLEEFHIRGATRGGQFVLHQSQ